jgi:hypothetical protein
VAYEQGAAFSWVAGSSPAMTEKRNLGDTHT